MVEHKSDLAPSWLDLERYASGETSLGENRSIEAALEHDLAARDIIDRIHADMRVLPPLPAAVKERPDVDPFARFVRTLARRWRWALSATGALAVAALVLLLVRANQPTIQTAEPMVASLPGPRVAIKGGDVAIALIRERAGVVAHDPIQYVSGDRFKVVVTCPPDMDIRAEVVIEQAGERSFPLATLDASASGLARFQCGNRVAIPGAFRLSGTATTHVCLAFSRATVIDRDALRRGAGTRFEPEQAVCTVLRADAAATP